MQTTATERFHLIDAVPLRDELAADVQRGLSLAQKSIPPHYFYDALGSALFEAICELPEYYVTRCESEILAEHASDIARRFAMNADRPARLVELGSGSARKTRYLIEALLRERRELEYVPIDIDAPIPTGGKAVVDIDWSFVVPEGGNNSRGVREQVKDGWIYEVAQWFPRAAVYDDVTGW
ncbi:MAG: L-histidine N(alpha)-methyltransferase, partial [Acidobacteriota bacterium]